MLVLGELGLYAVADGMGGLPHGGEAATVAVDALERGFRAAVPQSAADWRALVQAVNREVVACGRRLSPGRGLGTTLTALHLTAGRMYVVQVGDSAAFRWRAGRWTPLTAEHTVAARIRMERTAGRDPGMPADAGHMLTSCLGLEPLPQLDVGEETVQAGDRLLVCSDGITKVVPAAEIAAGLAAAATPAAAVGDLVDRANRRGGPDNATAVAVFCGG